jgi:hypothetical protein
MTYGRWKIIRELARGGQGTAFLVRDETKYNLQEQLDTLRRSFHKINLPIASEAERDEAPGSLWRLSRDTYDETQLSSQRWTRVSSGARALTSTAARAARRRRPRASIPTGQHHQSRAASSGVIHRSNVTPQGHATVRRYPFGVNGPVSGVSGPWER